MDVPKLPQCTAYGFTYKDAVGQAHNPIADWICGHRAAGYPIPKPSVHPAGVHRV